MRSPRLRGWIGEGEVGVEVVRIDRFPRDVILALLSQSAHLVLHFQHVACSINDSVLIVLHPVILSRV